MSICNSPCPFNTEHCARDGDHNGPCASFYTSGEHSGKERYRWPNAREQGDPEQLCVCGAPLRKHLSGRLCKLEPLKS